MRFRLSHQRGVVGNDLTVAVEVEEGQAIREIAVRYDELELVRERLEPPARSYEKGFRQQGGAAPGMEHRLVVTGVDESGESETAVSEWADET